MGSLISVDDIEIGQMIALHSLRSQPSVFHDDDEPELPSPTAGISAGVPLRVKAMSLPFLACEFIALDGKGGRPVIVDVRRVRVCKLDVEFVNAIIEMSLKSPIKKNHDDEVPF